jgi:putative cell wall-binding protein
VDKSAPMRLIALAILALVAALLAAVPPAAAQAPEPLQPFDNVERLDVGSFIQAGVAVSARSYVPETTDAVVIATDANFPDGLTASAVAGAVGGPVLFTRPSALPAETAAEVDRLLDPGDTVFVMGGDAAVSGAVEDELAADYVVRRIAGSSRLETAVAAFAEVGVPASGRVILARAFGPDGANVASDRTTGWVDAISCGAHAAAEGIPILLTQTEALSDSTRTALAGSTATDVIVCGGVAAIGPAVADELAAMDLDVQRVEGPTRIETAVAAARDLFGFSTAADRTYVVAPGYGESFGFGLAAAPLGHPILLTGTTEPTSCSDSSQPSRATLCYLGTASATAPAQLIVIGADEVIADEVVDAAAEVAGGERREAPDPLPAPSGVTAVDDINDDGTRLTVRWTAVADPDEILAGYNVYVDGDRVRGATPTTEAVTFVVEGLAEDVEVEITVTSVDVDGEESEPSAAVAATPVDEVPPAPGNVNARAGDGRVTVTFEPGPVDTARYTITRATDQPATTLPPSAGGCTSYAEVAVITNRSQTTFDDQGLTNGTGYCYRVTVTDTGGATSPVAQVGPVVPNVGVASATIQSPTVRTTSNGPLLPATVDRDTVHAGEPLSILYTLADSDTPLEDLRVTWEVSTNGGTSYGPIAGGADVAPTFRDRPSGAAVFTVPPCPTTGTAPQGCVTDSNTPNTGPSLRYRVTVVEPEGRATRVNTGNLEQSRAPGPVEGLAAVPGSTTATLSWDRKDSLTVDRYVVARLETDAPANGQSDPATCPTTGYDAADVPRFEVPQPAASQGTVTTTVTSLDNGTADDDIQYCFRVQAVRTLNGSALAGPGRIAAANPQAGLGGTIALRRPAANSALVRGQQETVTYEIAVPAGTTPQQVDLQYCADFVTSTSTCRSTGGFTTIPVGQLTTTPPVAIGSNSVGWRVPMDSTTAQGDGQTGAFRAVLTTSTGGSTALVSGIFFR